MNVDTKNRIYKKNIKMVVLSFVKLFECIKFNNPNGYQIIRFTEKSQYLEKINPYFVHKYRLVRHSSSWKKWEKNYFYRKSFSILNEKVCKNVVENTSKFGFFFVKIRPSFSQKFCEIFSRSNIRNVNN